MGCKKNVGGQALIEGVMMRCEDKKAVAVRKQDGDIVVKKESVKNFSKGGLRKIPIFRGFFAMVDSMIEGSKDLTYSADFFAEISEDEEVGWFDNFMRKTFGDKAESVLNGFSVVFAFAISICLFIVLPTFLAKHKATGAERTIWLSFREGTVKLGIFVGYLVVMSFIKDIRRVFQYHGAEHKSVFCNEKELELTVENVKAQSRLHPRCGTNFIFIVLIISIIIGAFVGVTNVWVRSVIKFLLFPLAAGVSYEFIRMAGKYQNPFTRFLITPGLLLQYITTKEPDESQIEVAIASIKAALGTDEVEYSRYLIKKDGRIAPCDEKGKEVFRLEEG
ncbi:MAG: DUF1385 domain-containing protein [Filifactoraceae bacterium]